MKDFIGRIYYICAYKGIYFYRFFRRPRTKGVQLILRSKDEALFVQHTYMHKSLWDCPGGGSEPNEEPIETMKREAREELGIDLKDIKLVGVCELYHDYIHDHTTVFEAWTENEDLVVDQKEIKTIQWFPVTNPPSNLSELTRNIWEIYRANK